MTDKGWQCIQPALTGLGGGLGRHTWESFNLVGGEAWGVYKEGNAYFTVKKASLFQRHM